MIKLLSANYLKRIGHEIFTACGAPSNEAETVTDVLVEASLMGLDSHGVMRYAQYVEQALDKTVKPGAPIKIVKETANSAIVDCGWNFGPVSATKMVEIVNEKANLNNMACVISKHSHHVGRLGTYVQKLAEKGVFAIATTNSSRHGHWVTPWGGREGRLATNPLAYGFPTEGRPIVFDMSTSMIAEGKIRILMNQGKEVPYGCMLDSDGNPTTDPKKFYGPPRGTIMPFGSQLGYKGFGLGLLVEVLSSTLAGEPVTANGKKDSYINGLCLIAINPESFCGSDNFKVLADNLCSYIKSAAPAPGYEGVILPGELDYKMYDKRIKEGIPVDEKTWELIINTAKKVGVEIKEE